MFTFGREREKEYAAHNTKDPQQIQLIHDVVDAVHDYLEKRIALEAIQVPICRAFVEGGSGVWEQTGAWLRKLAIESTTFHAVWRELARHTTGNVRFRVACFLNELPLQLARELGAELLNDRSKKVRSMTQARLEDISTEVSE